MKGQHRYYWTDKIVMPKMVIYWPKSVSRRKRYSFKNCFKRINIILFFHSST